MTFTKRTTLIGKRKESGERAIKLGAPLVEKNAEQEKLDRALISAAARGVLSDVKRLVKQGADVNYICDVGVNALYYARYHQYGDVAAFLENEMKNKECKPA